MSTHRVLLTALVTILTSASTTAQTTGSPGRDDHTTDKALPARHTGPGTDTSTIAIGETGATIVEFARSCEAAGFSGAILAARDGEVVAATGVSWADTGRTTPNTPATLFEIASLSKQFTAAAVLRLQQDGVLTIDDPIAKHLPGVPESCSGITIRHLLQHTSGIPGANSRGGGMDLDAVLPLFLAGGPRHEPGTHWEYWNQGYALLAEIITRASGRDFPLFCTESIFRRAGLDHTCFTGDTAPQGTVVAVGRSSRGPSRSALDHPYGAFGFQYRGMGGVVTSAMDLWRWDRALDGDEVLNAEQRAMFVEPGLNNYALGWFVIRSPEGRVMHTHGGGVRGFACDMRRYPAERACVIVLANTDDAPVRRVAQGVEELLFGQPLSWTPPLPARPFPAELAAALRGEYLDAQKRRLVVDDAAGAEDPTRLPARLEWGGSPTSGPTTHGALVQRENGDLFFDDRAQPVNILLAYGKNGLVTTITLELPGIRLAFERVDIEAPVEKE